MSAHRVLADLARADAEGSEGRPLIVYGSGAPSDTLTIGLVYIRTDEDATQRLYVWNGTAGEWKTVTQAA